MKISETDRPKAVRVIEGLEAAAEAFRRWDPLVAPLRIKFACANTDYEVGPV